jgi:SPP1 family predicted phage head-tail adaptor
MARTPRGAGPLFERIAFDERQPADDGYGNTIADWQEQFTYHAALVPIRGGETVLAAQLEGRATLILQVRRSDQTERITTFWRARNVRSGVHYNIRQVTQDPDRSRIELLCEYGVATG